ncbi:Uncharacterised protein [Vibrio cholerae]|nr:Uncharacterised protein [Vibrio cholerae]CSB50863.1 Uncharacterised protein [Vibrio cholerae]
MFESSTEMVSELSVGLSAISPEMMLKLRSTRLSSLTVVITPLCTPSLKVCHCVLPLRNSIVGRSATPFTVTLTVLLPSDSISCT